MEILDTRLIDPYLDATGRKITREMTPFGYWLGQAFFRPARRSILYMAYAYFRWLDDLVDQVEISRNLAIEIVERQRMLVQAWYSGKDPAPLDRSEALLRAVIEHDRRTGYRLHHMIGSFLAALAWDAERRHTVVSQHDLDRYSLWLGCAYAEGLLFGLGLDPADAAYQGAIDACGVAAHLAHLVRDLRIDLALGYINISTEDIERFSIDLADPRLRGVGRWVPTTVERAQILFQQGRMQRRAMPSLRARLVFDLVCLRYLRLLDQIRSGWLRQGTLAQADLPIAHRAVIAGS